MCYLYSVIYSGLYIFIYLTIIYLKILVHSFTFLKIFNIHHNINTVFMDYAFVVYGV